MLSAPDNALLVKLFYMSKESATIALRKFRVQKNVKSGKGPLTPAGLLKLVNVFEETGKLEDRARAGRPCERSTYTLHCCRNGSDCVEQLQGPAVLVKLPGDCCYHHHLSTIFFLESSSCTHTNCNHAMNFARRYRTEGSICGGLSLKWNRIPPGFLTSCGER
ncbi:hypothetical protein TNCV_2488441 [Trichonephila clavipes]|nr:hypothetical protein TNCV_2488441 [Trichonephila clavipes]